MEFLHPAMWHDHDIDFIRWLHPTLWCVVAMESGQWIHQVAAPYDVIRGSGMTCHWIRPVAAPWPCNVTRSSGIMTLNSLGGSTLQCGRCLWDDMPLNSRKRPPYLNSTSGFDFDHITSHRNFYPNRTTLGRKNYVMLIFKMADLSHLGFYGSNNGFFEKPNYITSYRSSIHHSWRRCSVSTQISEHVDTHCVVDSPIHTRRPGISSGGRTCLKHSAS